MSKVYAYITDLILEKLAAGTVPWRRPWPAGIAPINLVSQKPYRGINCLLLSMTTYESPLWLTAKQCKELGGNIGQGEKAMPIVFWKWWHDEESDADVKRRPMCRYYRVFNVQQCSGLPAPEHLVTPREFDPIAQAEAIIKGYAGGPTIETGHKLCCYDNVRDLVKLPSPENFDQGEEYYAAAFHELGHSTGHVYRLNRPEVNQPKQFGDHAYSREELVAELTAAFLCGEAGIEPAIIDNSAAYINGWHTRLTKEPRLIVVAAQWAQKSADWILGRRNGLANNNQQPATLMAA